jgi:hypothetical protein
MCPVPNFEALKRECYRVSFADDGAQVFTKIHFSSLKPGDLFVLEATPLFGSPVDPLAGEVAVERMFRATSEPYMDEPVTGDWLIDAERV